MLLYFLLFFVLCYAVCLDFLPIAPLNEICVFFLIQIFYAGMTVASFCYLQFFPPPYDADGKDLILVFNGYAQYILLV